MKSAALLCMLAVGAVAAPALASRTTVYSTNFESYTPDQYWTNAHIEIDAWNQFTDFNGRFSNSYTEFSHAQPAVDLGGGRPLPGDGGGSGAYVQYYLTFDFYAIDNWTLEHFDVTANNTTTLFSERFSNSPSLLQSFRAPNVGPTPLNFAATNDSIYRAIDLPFTVPNATDPIRLRFADEGGMQSLASQSWGIDNVTISYEVVPAPGSIAALGGLGVLSLRRRRR